MSDGSCMRRCVGMLAGGLVAVHVTAQPELHHSVSIVPED